MLGLAVKERDMENESIVLMSEDELVMMRKAGKLAARLLAHLGRLVRPGISTWALDDEAERWTQAHGAKSGPLGYHGFPKSICTSVNEVVCHGIPNKNQTLKSGDIINIDVSPILDGYYGDTSRTFLVGQVSTQAKNLVRATEEAMWLGIREVAPGKRIGDIGAAIQEYAESFGYGVVREFVGHGIGTTFHTAPQVPHFGKRGKGRRILPGMVFTVEPMINIGTWKTVTLDDDWTAVTQDEMLSAQFEHTIAVTENGYEVLTLPDEDS